MKKPKGVSHRQPRKTTTEKGEAATSIDHIRALSDEIGSLTHPDQERELSRKLNDFLRAAQTVVDFLQREPRGGRQFNNWIKTELDNLQANNPRHACLLNLRRVSAHDLNVRPSRSGITAKVGDQVRLRGSAEGALKDKAGKIVGRVYSAGPIDAEVTAGVPEVTTEYFLADWPNEDVVGFCQKSTRTLADLVTRVYAQFP